MALPNNRPNFTTKRPPFRMEYYFQSDTMHTLRVLAALHDHKILVEATNPNTAETGIVIEFSDEAAAKRFQGLLVSRFNANLPALDQEVRHA